MYIPSKTHLYKVNKKYISFLVKMFFFLFKMADINQTVRIILYCVIFLLSVLGNSLIITVLVRNRRMRTVTNLFLLSLAVSDLMLCVFCMPFTLIPNLMKNFVFGSGICKVATYFMGEWRL